MKIKEITINNALYFLVAKDLDPENYHVNLTAIACVGETISEKGVDYDPPKKNFARRGAIHSLDTTYELDDAQRVFSGSIKWDGCSDIDFFPDEEGNNHFCGKQSAIDLGLLLGEAYGFAKEIMGEKVYDDCFNS